MFHSISTELFIYATRLCQWHVGPKPGAMDEKCSASGVIGANPTTTMRVGLPIGSLNVIMSSRWLNSVGMPGFDIGFWMISTWDLWHTL